MSLYREDRTILDLCAGSGGWSEPYAQAGYHVVRVELKDGADARLWPSAMSNAARLPEQFDDVREWTGRVYGVLAAPVCTVFTGSGARWPRTDAEILDGLSLVDACLRIIHVVRPARFWALENPVGKLARWIGDPAWTFDPCDFGDPYTTKTCLWGRFNRPLKDRVPVSGPSPITTLGGKSERTKALRSVTPAGFAQAFFEANQ